MSDNAERHDDILHTDAKGDAAHVHREDVGGVTVFSIENENIYPKQADEIVHQVEAAITPVSAPKVLIDMSKVQFICSAFIGKLIHLHKLVHGQAGELKICAVGEHVSYTMKLVKLNSLMDIGGNRQALLASFQS